MLPPISGRDLAAVCRYARPSSGGSDSWRPIELRFLSDEAFAFLAQMLSRIEEGCSWPRALLRARAAMVEKGGKQFDPMNLRLLLVLPVIHRRWAALRLRQLDTWVQTWGLPDIYAGLRGRGASHAWFDSALAIAWLAELDIGWSLAAVDCYKCFDQVVRPLAFHLLALGGFPLGVLSACARYHEQVWVHSAVAGGPGAPTESHAAYRKVAQGACAS